MDHSELLYYLALYAVPGIGAHRLISLREYFGDAERAFKASRPELERVSGIGRVSISSLLETRASFLDFAHDQIHKLGASHKIITYFDEEYPKDLKAIYDPPALLFLSGNYELLSKERKVAVIGTRKITDYGKRVTKEFCTELVAQGVVIVSGFARGVDTAAHVAAVESGGTTIAVLGSGLDIIYPATNKALAKQLFMEGNGLLVSELPFGSAPDARNFPWRNRIVSGLSQGVMVVESDLQGGSMITASLALDQNKEVFAVPGDIHRPASSGPNYLIQESRAKCVRNAEGILADLGWTAGSLKKKSSASESAKMLDLSLFEQRIVQVLEEAAMPIHIDVLSERSSIEVQDLLVHLLNLEFKSVVRQLAGKQFTIIS